MIKSKDKLAKDVATPVSFPRLREVLIAEKMAPTQHLGYEREIFGCLKYLKAARLRASVATVLDYLHELEEQGKETREMREALRWFFQAAAQQSAGHPAPPLIRGEKEDPGDFSGLHASSGKVDILPRQPAAKMFRLTPYDWAWL